MTSYRQRQQNRKISRVLKEIECPKEIDRKKFVKIYLDNLLNQTIANSSAAFYEGYQDLGPVSFYEGDIQENVYRPPNIC